MEPSGGTRGVKMHLVVQQNSLLCRGGDRVHCGLIQPGNLYLQQGRRDDLMAVSTWRTLMWIGLWWEEEVDFGKQCKAELHIGLLRLLPVCCSTREGTRRKGLLEMCHHSQSSAQWKAERASPRAMVTGSGTPSWAVRPAREGETCEWGRNFRGHRNWKKLWKFFISSISCPA